LNKIKIKTKTKSYNVFIGNSILPSVIKWINKLNLHKNIFAVIDENVMNLHKEYITNSLVNHKSKIHFYLLRSNENSKSFEGLSEIISALLSNNFGRDTILLSIGGGVTGDLAGFAASVYMRGIQLVHIPTTLLAAADSAVGGKTGVNFNNYKNIAGTFFQPDFVLIDTKFLSTLPEAELNSGTGELIKYAFITNKDFFNNVNNNFEKIFSLDKKFIDKIIYESVLFKGSVISKDEFEGGLRKILNFGHTFAHAYESLSNYQLKHGEAVTLGIISALFLSAKAGILSEKKLTHFLGLPLKMKLSSLNMEDYSSVLRFMYGDKKNKKGEINFILLNDIGKVITDVTVNERDILYSIEKTKEIVQK